MEHWIWRASQVDKLIYFGKEAVKQRKVWILGDEEGFMELGPDKPSGTEIEFTLPVYSSKELAEAVCQKEELKECKAIEMDLEEFLYSLCFQLMEDGGSVALYYDGKRGYVVNDLRSIINGIEAESHKLTPENALPFTEFEEEEEEEEECPPHNRREFKSMLKQTHEKRYKIFVGAAVSWEKIWVLKDEEEDIVMLQDNNGFQGIGVWPYRDFAEYVQRQKEFKDCKVSNIGVYDFLEAYIPDLQEKKLGIAVFYNGKDFVPVDDVEQLAADIQEELDRI